jgi:hypothetical protein
MNNSFIILNKTSRVLNPYRILLEVLFIKEFSVLFKVIYNRDKTYNYFYI